MYKGKEWLKNEVEKNLKNADDYSPLADVMSARTLDKLIDQLDEPAVSSETVTDILDSNRKLSKRIKELENQLEESEQKKVVVPQFVADYIEIAKQDITLMRVFDIAQNYDERDIWEKEYEWVRANHEKFAKAWFGYTVEKEKLYKIKLSDYDYLVQDEDGTIFTMDTNLHEYKTKFTEQEIKNIDERFWAFAEEVTD